MNDKYRIAESDKKWCDAYLKSRYVGCVKGKYEDGCNLYFKDLNNFVQNAGRYSDLEVFKIGPYGEYEILFNTNGTFINQIWPELSWNDRSSEAIQTSINYIATRLGENIKKEGLYPAPLPKVEKYLEISYGKETVQKNKEYLEIVNAEDTLEMEIDNHTDSKMEMKM